MKLNIGDRVTVTRSPYVWKITKTTTTMVTVKGEGSPCLVVPRSAVLSIVARAKTAADFRALAAEGNK